MQNNSEILEVLVSLEHAGLANPPAHLPEFFVLAAKSLAGLPIDAIRNGVQNIVMTSEFFPRIASLRKAAETAKLSGHSRLEQTTAIRPEIARARATQHLADKNPITWTEQDHAEFERWFGHPVFWKGAPIDTGEMETVND